MNVIKEKRKKDQKFQIKKLIQESKKKYNLYDMLMDTKRREVFFFFFERQRG